VAELRVTGGEFKGRRLYAPRTGIRPTTGRVREALFSMVGDVSGKLVLDLFCGTGALGIEALSRGASEVHFVDKKPAAVIRNLEDLGIANGRYGWQVFKLDVLDFLEQRAIFERERMADLVLCDPPYRLADHIALGLDITIPGVVREGARVVVETARRSPLTLSFPLVKERGYGDTLLRIYSVEPMRPVGEEAR
jgi:16S rRNA (guanine966-N2)-methyltransferase